MLFRHSIKAKILFVITVVFILQLVFSVRTMIETYAEFRTAWLTQVSNDFDLQCKEMNRQILILQKSLQQLALQGEMYITLPPEWRPERIGLIQRVLAETPQAIGGGIWFEPYMENDDVQRSCIYFRWNEGRLEYDPGYESLEYDYLSQMWYDVIRERGKSPLQIVWTPVYMDSNSEDKTMMTTLGCSLFSNERFMGMVTLDWELPDITQRIDELLSTPGSFAVFADVTNNMMLVDTRNKNGDFGKSLQGIPRPAGLKEGQGEFTIDEISYVSFMHIMDNDMVLLLAIPRAELYAPIREDIYAIILQSIFFTMVLLVILWHLLQRFISTPIRAIADKTVRIGAGDLTTRIEVNDKGELGMLAQVVNSMTENIQSHIAAMQELTQEKERIAAELDVAARIQQSLLPCIFPPFPQRNEFSLHACMRPAREVGGDLYDFFLIDDTHLALVIADVSGKGVPAGLFMAIAKTLLKNHLQAGLSPHEVMVATNKQLCENNSTSMFVTVWLGVLNLESGLLKYANAAHNKPLLIPNSASPLELGTKRSFVLGGMEGIPYESEECTMQPGDRLIIYTDGITEAENSTEDQFGVNRLMLCAEATRNLAAPQAVSTVLDTVETFAGNAPQYDDITLLILDFLGTASKARWQENVLTTPESFTHLSNTLEETLEHFACPLKTTNSLLLAFEEIFVNIMSYAYAESPGYAVVSCEVHEQPAADGGAENEIKVVLRFRDSGPAFNPLEHDEPDFTSPIAERKLGGLGIHMLRKMMDTIDYERQGHENVLTVSKGWKNTVQSADNEA